MLSVSESDEEETPKKPVTPINGKIGKKPPEK
jgi:hypothetical protein